MFLKHNKTFSWTKIENYRFGIILVPSTLRLIRRHLLIQIVKTRKLELNLLICIQKLI
jgi:hypothetical protein